MPSLRLLVFLTIAPGALMAQDSSDVRLTAEHRPSEAPVTAGVTTGSMSFADHRVQQGITGVVRYHLGHALSVAVSPTYARVSYPASLGGGAVSGLTDLPIELGFDHDFDARWSPAAGLSLGVTVPVGSEPRGFGSGSMGASLAAGVGLSPTDEISMHLGAGKSLTDYSMFGALGASESMWSEAEVSWHALERLEATIGYDGNLAATDTAGTARAIALSFAAALSGPYALTLSGGRGLSGPAARWTFALGIGTDFAGFQAIGSSSPIQRLMRSVGGSSHHGPGSGNSGSGHGRAP